jgi:hypothetical protein
MITIKNWDKLIRLFRSKLEITESDMCYLIRYYYPTLATNDYYTITLSRVNPPYPNHVNRTEYLMLCGDESRWLSKKDLGDIDIVYDAIIEVVARHDLKING